MLTIQGSKHFCPTTRIVRREDYLLNEQASQIIENAKIKRDKLMKQAYAQLNLMQENTKLECDSLRKKVASEGEQQCQEKQLELALSMLSNGIHYYEKLEQTFVEILKELFLKMLGEYPSEERMYAVVKRTIKRIPEGNFLRISVHPEQAILVKAKVGDLQALQDNIKRIEVVADQTLPLDSCILETETGVIDAGIQCQLETLLKAIKEKLM
ncbi:MAG TPA: HrpE/YscL family type III secretion apparatus protein [Opitutae bacterium]|nr:HrpE/YscL family type III secretion apparatus protein [Opitutae bacterium]